MNKYTLYDTHAHTNLEPLKDDVNNISKQCQNQGILFNCIGTNFADSKIAINQSSTYENIYATIGIHPSEVVKDNVEEDIKKFCELYNNHKSKIVAIGEVGLDYHYENTKKDLQQKYFIAFIKLANKLNLPIVVHVRDAHEDSIAILKKYNKCSKILIHCFSSDINVVKQYLNFGCYISIPGIISFKNAKLLHEAVKAIPLDRLMVETDCPWLSPAPHRGEVNSPIYISFVAKKLATKINIKYKDLLNQIFKNSVSFFNIKNH